MENKNLVCINCPMGCGLEVKKDGKDYKVAGNACKRGVDYAVSELTDPRRIVTSSVFVKGGTHTTVSVKTSSEIPKGLIFKCVEELSNIKVKAPVRIGDVIVENILDTGVDILATRRVDKRPQH